MDKLSVMNAFCRIVERGSFSRAAEDLGVSATLLSREIKLLEESLGCSLLTRTTRTMSLTDHGHVYYEEAQGILDAVGQVEGRLRMQSGVVRGHLRINAPNAYGQIVLSPLLPEFLRQNPELRLTLSLEDKTIDMIKGGFDLSIRVHAQLPDSSLIARPISEVKQYIFASPDYLARGGTPEQPGDLGQHQIISFTLADHATKWTLIAEGELHELPIDPKVSVGSSLVLRDLLIAGHGIGTLPDFISDAAEASGALVRVLPRYELTRRHVFAVTASRLGSDTKVTAFLDYLRTAMRQ